MAWTANITEVVKNKVACDITVEVSKDGKLVDTFVIPNVNPPESAKVFALARLAQYQAIDEFDENTLIGEVTPEAPEQTPEQIAFALKAQLTDLKQRLDVKMIDQTAYDAAVAALKASQ